MKNILITLLIVSYGLCSRWVTIDGQIVSNDKLIIQISENYAPQLGIEPPLTISTVAGMDSILSGIVEKDLHPLFSGYSSFGVKHRQFNLHRYYVLEFEQQADIQSLAGQLIQLPDITSVEYNSRAETTSVPNDDLYPHQWAHDNQGQAVAYDGQLVGEVDCDTDTDLASGAAYIYKNINSTWQKIKKIIPSNLEYGDMFGETVSMTDDYVFIGAPMKNGLEGAVYIYDPQDTTLHANFAGDVNYSGQIDIIDIVMVVDEILGN